MIFKRSLLGYFGRSRRCFFGLLVALFLGDPLPAQVNYLNLIQDKLRNGAILSAQFNHEFIDAYTKET